MRLRRTILATPIGDMLAIASDEALCALEFVNERRNERLEARRVNWFPPHTLEEGSTRAIDRAREWLAEYFSGHGTNAGRRAPRSSGKTPVPLAMYGTEFERRVWNTLLGIPPGETTTYGAIARQLGNVGASRAVGLANGSNPIAIIVPCHRVIGSSGDLTGYGGGLERKRWLLAHERDKFTRTLLSV